jgi:CheB methylesterase
MWAPPPEDCRPCRNLLRNLAAKTRIAFVLVQHLDPHHESILADLLSNYTPMQIRGDGLVSPGHVFEHWPRRSSKQSTAAYDG